MYYGYYYGSILVTTVTGTVPPAPAPVVSPVEPVDPVFVDHADDGLDRLAEQFKERKS